MKKGIYIKGAECTGKTLLCTMLFPKEEILWIDGRSFFEEDDFIFSEVTENTKYIIIDDLVFRKRRASWLTNLLNQTRLKINKPLKDALYISMPLIIITANELLNDDASFQNRFDIYDTATINMIDILGILTENKIFIK